MTEQERLQGMRDREYKREQEATASAVASAAATNDRRNLRRLEKGETLRDSTIGSLALNGYVEIDPVHGNPVITDKGFDVIGAGKDSSRKYRHRMRAAGYLQINTWVHKDDTDRFRQFIKNLKDPTGAINDVILDAVAGSEWGFRDGWISSWALANKLAEGNIPASPVNIAKVMEDLGYERVGRATTNIAQEGNTRPVIYCAEPVDVEFTVRYLESQVHH